MNQATNSEENLNYSVTKTVLTRIVLPLAVLMALAGSGCVSAGRRIDADKLAQIVNGESTRADVERLLGKPTMITEMNGGGAMLMYSHLRYRSDPQNVVPILALLAGGGSTKSETVMITIGPDDKVRDINSSRMQMHVNTGLISGTR
jgi:hypothetical protein